MPQSWLGRALFVFTAGLLVFIALFFFIIFLVVGSVVFAVLLARLIWVTKRAPRKQIDDNAIEGEYSVAVDVEELDAQPKVNLSTADDGTDTQRPLTPRRQ